MIATTGDETRHVIPRWRSLRRTLDFGEFKPVERRVLSDGAELELSEVAANWRDRGGVSRASEFVGAAIVMGVPERAIDAAAYLAKSYPSDPIQAMIDVIFKRNVSLHKQPNAVDEFLVPKIRIKIVGLKLVTTRDPRNAIAWLDLARLYTIVGQRENAHHAMFVAVALAPTNRFILRSAVAFYSHVADYNRAYELVRRHPAIHEDPWILAADLAVTAEAGRKQVNIRHARKVLESGHFPDLALSELASELGTLELSASGGKRARQHFARAMIDPSENAAAQAEWAVKKQPSIQTWSDESQQAGEPAARYAERMRDWTRAAGQAEIWLADQPFSVEAAAYASYAAAIAEDYGRSIELAEAGLRANPDALVLLNNLAYSLIEINELERAKGQLDKANSQLLRVSTDEVEYREVLAVTRGLLAIRQGNIEEGISSYHQVIDRARSEKNRSLEVRTLIMLALELQTLEVDDDTTMNRAVSAAQSSVEPGIRELLDRLLRRSEILKK